MSVFCDQCGNEVLGWRLKIEAPFHFCDDECEKEFLDAIMAQIQRDNGFREGFLQRLGNQLGSKS